MDSTDIIINMSFTKEEINRLLEYGDTDIDNLEPGVLDTIINNIATRTKERMMDEPHYAFEDFIEEEIL